MAKIKETIEKIQKEMEALRTFINFVKPEGTRKAVKEDFVILNYSTFMGTAYVAVNEEFKSIMGYRDSDGEWITAEGILRKIPGHLDECSIYKNGILYIVFKDIPKNLVTESRCGTMLLDTIPYENVLEVFRLGDSRIRGIKFFGEDVMSDKPVDLSYLRYPLPGTKTL